MKLSFQRLKNLGHLVFAVFTNFYFGYPSRGLTIIGVTGTDGKTTTANLIFHILSVSGIKCALVSTTGVIIGDKKYELNFHVTTPSPFLIQKYIKKAKKENCKVVIIETTSHAIDQNRVYGINFDISVLTNITHEHLDYHKTYQNYVNTKLKLLKRSKIAIANADDASFEFVKKEIPKDKLLTYSLDNKNSDINLEKFSFTTNLIGDFNKYNILASVLASKKIGIEEALIREAIKTFKAPRGRQEIVYDKDFMIMVDFAHTPNAFAKILPALKKAAQNGKLIHVFGSAGERDKSKRLAMGRVSSSYADFIILTSEDPRSENIKNIDSDIEEGFNSKFRKVEKETLPSRLEFVEIDDRKEALFYAVKIAKKGDVILATGKGHEKSINYGNGEIPWSEVETLRQAIKYYEI
jgi:UDP-N-acetylmuramoyl-L-alanyl-D-glutamate--2,6-diaminopimelate ligase